MVESFHSCPLNEGGQRRSKYVKVTSATEAWQLVGACSDAAVLSRSFASFFFLISWPVAFSNVGERVGVPNSANDSGQSETNHKSQIAARPSPTATLVATSFLGIIGNLPICLQFRTQIPSNLSFSSVGRVSARSHLALSWRRHANKSEVAWVTSSVWGLLALLWILMPTHWQTFWLKLGRNGWGEPKFLAHSKCLKPSLGQRIQGTMFHQRRGRHAISLGRGEGFISWYSDSWRKAQ